MNSKLTLRIIGIVVLLGVAGAALLGVGGTGIIIAGLVAGVLCIFFSL